MGFDAPSLKARALRLLALREHSRLELARKLAVHETQAGELARVLDELQAKGYIQEQRVLASVLHQRSGRWGASRIRQELQAKGLAADTIEPALQALKESELARAAALFTQKFGSPATEPRLRLRQQRFMLGRGFDAATVRRVLAQAGGAAGEDLDDIGTP